MLNNLASTVDSCRPTVV